MRNLPAVVGVGLACAAALGCGDGEQTRATLASTRSEVISGADDRLDWYEVDDPSFRDALLDATVAFVYPHRLRLDAPAPAFEAPALAEALDLCEEERFREQPSWAFCTGVLVDRDLVMTAGHCLGGDLERARDRCSRLRLVFGYYLAEEGRLAPLAYSGVHACRDVALHRVDETNGTADFAVVQLDRPVAPGVAPAVVSSDAVEVGDRLSLAGHGAGLPLKIELAAAVTATLGEDAFIAATDSFAGGSGSGIYAPDGRVVGLQVAGSADWISDGCRRAAVVSPPNERFLTASLARRGLCDGAWPSPALCGTEHMCGDGICGPGEGAVCDADCAAPRCGDRVCEPPEYGSCALDCDSYADVPPSWSGDPEVYRRSASAGSDAGSSATGSSSACSVRRVGAGRGAAWRSLLAAAAFVAWSRRRIARRTCLRGPASRRRLRDRA